MTEINLLSKRAKLSTLLYRKAEQVLGTANMFSRECMARPSTDTMRLSERYIDAFYALERTFYRVCGCSRFY